MFPLHCWRLVNWSLFRERVMCLVRAMQPLLKSPGGLLLSNSKPTSCCSGNNSMKAINKKIMTSSLMNQEPAIIHSFLHQFIFSSSRTVMSVVAIIEKIKMWRYLDEICAIFPLESEHWLARPVNYSDGSLAIWEKYFQIKDLDAWGDASAW